MAFIRWKKNASGKRQAYLIQSYRDENGKPKHKMLAYLGDESSFTPEKVAGLKVQYPEAQLDWDNIKLPDHHKVDIAALSDAELLRNLRTLRHQWGFDQVRMYWLLEKFGLPRCTTKNREGMGLGRKDWGILERALEKGEKQDYFAKPEAELVPAIRKAYLSRISSSS